MKTKLNISPVAVGFLALMVLLVVVSAARAEQTNAARQKIRDDLRLLSSGKGEWHLLTVTYDDLHPFHGGLTLTIRGDGSVEQKVLRAPEREPRKIPSYELIALVNLLYERKAWQQQSPERPAIPDESKARLTVSYGDDSVTIWEWYNEMSKNRRLSEIIDLMKKIAWKNQ